jgi:hypothetical protein
MLLHYFDQFKVNATTIRCRSGRVPVQSRVSKAQGIGPDHLVISKVRETVMTNVKLAVRSHFCIIRSQSKGTLLLA